MAKSKSYKCYKGHLALALGDGKVIYGGSCWHPAVSDADIYVGLDALMILTEKSYPWNEQQEVKFKITDSEAPADSKEFTKMVVWLSAQIDAGKKVHVGCIGGHGRTGMLLAALVAYRKVDDDPIAYVRKHYCKKAVESQAQVDYLVKKWKCKPAEPRKYKVTALHGHDVYSNGALGEFAYPYKPDAVTHMPKIADYVGTKSKCHIDSGTPMRAKDKTVWTDAITHRP